jgi:hypothetical protein
VQKGPENAFRVGIGNYKKEATALYWLGILTVLIRAWKSQESSKSQFNLF